MPPVLLPLRAYGAPRTSRTAQAVPRFGQWPIAVQTAERLRGTLVPCGPGMRGVGWPETPHVRATAIAPWTAQGLIAIRLTAAWIWGASRSPGRPLECSTRALERPAASTRSDLVVRQMRYDEAELHAFEDDLVVTSPARTACDLLRMPEPHTSAHTVALRLLYPLVPGGREAIRALIADGRRQYRAVALRRIDAGPPLRSGVSS